jgi:hypothetical protein|tara:strand:- start:107 stop:436 length:330 start_codon:yes stop_codon:yes gene_type:complete
MAEPMMPPMQGANMPPMPEMQGANMPMQGGMPPEAKANLMRPSEEITAVLMARLANMSEQELSMLDSAISPETARILMKLLPELAELINAVSGEGQPMQEEMGALSNMG